MPRIIRIRKDGVKQAYQVSKETLTELLKKQAARTTPELEKIDNWKSRPWREGITD